MKLQFDEANWQAKLRDAFFPVKETSVLVGTPPTRSKKYKAIVSEGPTTDHEPFAIVTNSYRLIRNDDAMDLGYEAFERTFGTHIAANMTVFNVIVSESGGSFLADLTSPALFREITPPGSIRSNDDAGHLFYLRVTNSYNRTRAVRVETGLCRWICRNGLIFGDQSIRFRDPHHKSKNRLMDDIAKTASRLSIEPLQESIGYAYSLPLDIDGGVLHAMLQNLRLTIPTVESQGENSPAWISRCSDLHDVADNYSLNYGETVFSALQASSEWVQRRTNDSPIVKDSYERRCGEMLNAVQRNGRWPKSPMSASESREQLARVVRWTNLANTRN